MQAANAGLTVLALDIGSSSARAGLFDGTGQLIEGTLHRVPYRLETGAEGRAELDPLLLTGWIEELLDAVQARTTGPVTAVGISCFWHSLMGIDEQGSPTTSVTMWADTRACDVAMRLRHDLDAQAHHRRTGAYLHPSYPVARLAWLREAKPECWRVTRWWCAFPDFLLARWTGDLCTSVSMASGTGLFDTHRLTWDDETNECLGIKPEQLPRVSDTPLKLREPFRQRWPHFANALWYPAWGDGACSNVGSAGIGVDRATVMIGTSSAVRVLWRGRAVEPSWGTWLYRLDSDFVLAGGALSEGGDLVDWIRRRFVLPPEPELWELVGQQRPGTSGLLWLPTIAGERSPRWPVDAVATLTGLRLGHDGVAILRAALEAIACRVATVVELVLHIRPEVKVFIASGNALLATPGWTQIVADAVGQTLVLAPDPEASLRGAALVALARVTGRPLEELARVDVTRWQRVEPRGEATMVYRAMSTKMAALEEALETIQERGRAR